MGDINLSVEEPEDKVDHPNHYTYGKYETIEVIEDWKLGYHIGSAIKYLSRYRHKHKSKTKQIEDLKKAVFFINRMIKVLKEDD